MRVQVQSILSCPAELVWKEVKTSRLLCEITWPLIRLTPVGASSFPERWQTGTEIRCRPYLLGIIPLGVRTLVFESVDDGNRQIQTREHDALVQRWDHRIRVRPASLDGASSEQTLYSDEIEIGAGLLTPLVWLFALGFYRHRQRRWRRVATRLARVRESMTTPI